MKVYPSTCTDLTTPFTDTTRIFLSIETAPYAQSSKELVIGPSPGLGCIEIAALGRDNDDSKLRLGRKLGVGNSWSVEIGDNSHRYLYVLGGKRPPCDGKVTLSSVAASAGDSGIGTGTGVAMEGAGAVAVAAGGTAVAASVASLGAAIVIGVGVLAYYAYKRSSSRTVYFVRIGRRPFLNSGEKGRFLYRCSASGDHTAYSLAEAALSNYSGWSSVKKQMKKCQVT